MNNIQCEMVNKALVVLDSISDTRNYCRWVVYDNNVIENMPKYMMKARKESFGRKTLAFFTVYDDGTTEIEFNSPCLTLKEVDAIVELARNSKYE